RIAAERMTKLVEENARRERESYIGLRRLHASTHSTIGEAIAKASKDTHEITQDSASEMKRKLEELDSTMQKSERTQSRHVTSTVRDSTRQVESLIQIYTRFKDLKLPMPSTGGVAIDAQAHDHLLSIIEDRQPNNMLELESGASTVWLGYLCQSFVSKKVTLDHIESYLDLTRTEVERHELKEHVECRLAPLEPVES